MIETIAVGGNIVDGVADGSLILSANELSLPLEPYTSVILANGKQSILTTITPDLTLRKISSRKILGVKPRSAEQVFYMHYLIDNNIDMVVATGRCGTGKSILALVAAINAVIEGAGTQDTIIMAKCLSEVGKYRLGTVPGNLREKMDPYVGSYKAGLHKILGKDFDIELYEMKGILQFVPINVLRGWSIENSIVIIDEAQNLSKMELRTLCTRIGENSRLFMLGDVTQSDESDGGYALRTVAQHEAILQSSFCATVELIKNERSKLSLLLDNVLS